MTLLLSVACASNDRNMVQPTLTPSNDVSSSNQPPPSFNEEEHLSLKEEKSYQSSVSKIEERFHKEYLNYNICLETHGPSSQDCVNLLQRYCITSVLIDTRGGHHNKPYCSVSN